MLSLDDYVLGKALYHSSSSTILAANHKTNFFPLLIKYKAILSRYHTIYPALLNEILLLSRCSHPNIVKFLGYSEKEFLDQDLNESFIGSYIFMELLDQNLKINIKTRSKGKKKGYFDFSGLRKLIVDICSAMGYLEKQEIAFQDLKSSNIVFQNSSNSWKIVDFSSAISLFGVGAEAGVGVGGTLSYNSPEKMEAIRTNTKINKNPIISDVYSAGLVFLEAGVLKKIEKVREDVDGNIKEIEEKYNRTMGEVIKTFLEKDCEKRLSFLGIVDKFPDFFNVELNSGNSSPIKSNSNFSNKGSIPNMKDSQLSEKFVNNSNNSSNIISQVSNKPGPDEEVEQLISDAEQERKKEEFQKSFEKYEKALKIKLENNVREDLQVAKIFAGIGNVCLETMNFNKGKDLHEKSLEIKRKLIGENSKFTADSYNSIGVAYHGLGNFEKAVDFFERALYIYENVLGAENKTTVRSYNNVGGCYSILKKHQKALEFKKIALEIKIRMEGNENEDVAWSYENISNEYSLLGKDEKAFSFKEKALDIRKKVWGEKHHKTADSYHNMAEILLKRNEFEKALNYSEISLKIRMNLYGKNRLETGSSYGLIGECYKALGEKSKALENLEKSYNICISLIGEEHTETKRIKHLLEQTKMVD